MPGQRHYPYIRTWEGWLYLATVIDCHTRGVIGWSMAEHMRTDLVADAITMATGNVELDPNAVFHSTEARNSRARNSPSISAPPITISPRSHG